MPEYITPKDTWAVAGQFFKDFGVVSQQLTSFNYFIEHTIPHLFATTPPIVVTCKNPKSSHRYETHKITFGQVYLSKPRMSENDSSKKVSTPVKKKQEQSADWSDVCFVNPDNARIRNLSYSSQLYVNIDEQVTKAVPNEPVVVDNITYPKTPMGDIPIMVKSKPCPLSDASTLSLADMNECDNDPGGYFIQNGVEKVLIAQEKMRNNRILVDVKMTSGGKKIVTAKIRCAPEMSCKPPSEVSMNAKLPKGKNCETIKVLIPYIRQEVFGILNRVLSSRYRWQSYLRPLAS